MAEEKIKLPSKKVAASRINPKRLVLYSKPKTGKTSAIAGLENCLILDLEKGSDFIEALKVQVNDVEDLKKIGEAIKDADYPYQFVAIDTVTSLEDMIKPLALKKYKETPIGKNFQGDNVLSLPSGAGYFYLREAFFSVLNYIDTFAPNIILLGHIKDRQVEIKGKEVIAADVDLTGKIKSLICANADAIGYLYRNNNQTIVSFITSDTVTCGARPQHLKNKEFVLSEMQEDGTIQTFWDKIFLK